MAGPSLVIRVAANIDDLRSKLKDGNDIITVTTAGMEKLSNSLNGGRLLQNANNIVAAVDKIGGASKLTEAESTRLNATLTKAIEKYNALGIQAPKAMTDLANATKKVETATTEVVKPVGLVEQSLARLGPMIAATFTVQAVIGFAKEVGAFAGRMTDLSAETQIGVERLQAFNYIGAGVGLTVEDMTNGVQQLARRLSDGDKSAVGALGKLNLNVQEFMHLSADQQLIAVAEAASKVTDRVEQTGIMFDLFGRTGSRMLRLVSDDLGKQVAVVENSGAVIQKELIARADAFDDAWSQAIIRVKASLVSFAAAIPDIVTAKDTRLALPDAPDAPRINYGSNAVRPQATIAELDALINVGAELRKVEAAHAKVAAAKEKAEQAQKTWIALVERESGKLRDLSYSINAVPVAIENMNASMQEDIDNSKGDGLIGKLIFGPAGVSGNNPIVSKVKSLGESIVGTLNGALGSLNNIFQSAFEGGGGIGGAVKSLGTNVLASLTKLIPGVGPFISQFSGAIVAGFGKLFGGLFGGEGKATNNERDTWIAQNFGTSDDLRKLAVEAGVTDSQLRQLFSTKKVEDFRKIAEQVNDQIHGFADDQEADTARLQAAIEKYGFTIEELGPALQRQKLGEQALEIAENWRVLVGAGIDIATVNTRMGEEMGNYLDLARKTGQEVPNEMRPIIESMIKQGALLDENGKAYTNMGQLGISFSQTMTQGFDKVAKRLEALIGIMNGGVIPAFEDAADAGAMIGDSAAASLDLLRDKSLETWRAMALDAGASADEIAAKFGQLSIPPVALPVVPVPLSGGSYSFDQQRLIDDFLRNNPGDEGRVHQALGFAKGGIVTKPTYGVFGEAGPEAIMPLSKVGDFVKNANSDTMTKKQGDELIAAIYEFGDTVVRRVAVGNIQSRDRAIVRRGR